MVDIGFSVVRGLAEQAVEAALAAGASYADARALTRRSQRVATKNGRVDSLADEESEGIGVRVLVGGAWGFACDRRLGKDGAQEAARRACAFAAAAPGPHKRDLSPVEPGAGEYRTPLKVDPFSISLSEKIELCLNAEAALEHPAVKVRQAFVRAQREHKIFASSEGAVREQEPVACGRGLD